MKLAKIFITLLALVLVTACSSGEVSKNEKETLVVVSWGGTGTDAQREAWYKPFTEETGIEIIEVSPPSTPQLVAQVDSGQVEWDLVLMDAAQIESIKLLGDYLEKIPYDKLDQKLLDELTDEAKREYGFGSYYWGWNLTYRTDAYAEPPKDWKDFWDVEKFPGPRTIPNRPFPNMELAMMAQGQDKDNLYPLDFDAGFSKLEELAPNISSLWNAGAEGIQLLADNEASMGLIFTIQAIANKNQGVPVDIVWDVGLYSMDNWVIPKGKANENVLKFIEFVSQAEQQAEITKYVPYGPINEKAFEFIDEEVQKDLITHPDNMKNMIDYNSEWWGPHRDELTERWNEWILNIRN